jgi:heptosyltransferase-3
VSKPVDFTKVRNVLILRTDHLGDLLLSTPLIRTMRTALPGRRFTLVASPANAEALMGWDAVDEVLVFDPDWPLTRKWAFLQELWQTGWDLCLTLSPRTPSYILGRLSEAPVRAGIIYSRRILARLFSAVWLTHPVVMEVDERLAAGKQVPHEVEQLAEIAEILGLPASEPGPLEFPLKSRAMDWAREWLAAHGAPVGEESKRPCIIGIHGAGKWLAQGWTAADFLTLVRSVAAFHNDIKVLLTFGPGDTDLQTAVKMALAEAPCPSVLWPGPLTVSRWAALFSQCDAIISPDTGSLHLAVALGRPVVAMYEADTFSHCSAQWAPWQVPSGIVRRGTPGVTVPLLVGELLRLLPPGRLA